MKGIETLLRYDYRYNPLVKLKNCPSIDRLCSYVNRALAQKEAQRIEMHLNTCYRCLDMAVSIYDGAAPIRKRRYKLKKESLYLILGLISFVLSFIFKHYFLQFLTAAVILSIKWIVDSKTSRMLVMIYEAWRHGGEKEAGRILEDIQARRR